MAALIRQTLEQRIIAQDKPLGLSLADLKVALNSNRGRISRGIALKGIRAIQVRLIVVVPTFRRKTWSLSLLLNDIRADGIDWHVTTYTDTEGAKRIGWHRHIWCPQRRTGEALRQHLPDFDPATTEDFILEGFSIMGVSLKGEVQNARGQMSFG